MERSKIQEIVQQKNDEFERTAIQSAHSIIEQIASEQASIAKSEARIVKLRSDLKELEIKQMDTKQILGE